MNKITFEQDRYNLRNARIRFIGVLISLLYLVVGIRLIFLQVISANWLADKASAQYQRSVQCRGKRGTIFDTNYRELAVSSRIVEVGVHPRKIKTIKGDSDPDKKKLAKTLARILNQNADEIYEKITADKSFVWLDRKLSPARAKALKAINLKGFEYYPSYVRAYPLKTLSAQLIGLFGVDGYGLEGVEKQFDTALEGKPRQWTIIRDRMGRIFEHQEDACPSGYSGGNIVLSIDSTIQYIAETALKKSVEDNNAKSGLALVMSPDTGAVKAIAHYPTFNPNSYKFFPEESWRNRSVTDAFEPGSVMKVFLIAAALESGICDPEMIINCEKGAYRVGRKMIHDTHVYDFLSVHDVLKFSSNIGAVKIAEMLGAQSLYNMLTRFGFGEKTGINCMGEVSGILRHYQRWQELDMATIAFGQGITVTPIQLITAISAIANHGILMKPYVIRAITDSAGHIIKSVHPSEKRRVISPETARMMMKMMNAVTDADGTGGQAVPVGYTVSGKTGTAQKLNAFGNYRNCEYNGVFVGFAPSDSPILSVLVVIDEPQKYHYGGIVAAPVFREIVHKTFNYLNIPPNKIPAPLEVANKSGEIGA